ncbi:hypothetical protein M6B38_323200 [Iris pallida]|uniref:Uncharacterized protein n=1 Tax=Iris pallida TaxID=29817 RepID=A0AAX6HAT2_IRIPA|nr:hypothetical protein M6B38_323200 [Iris pallida]
MRAYQFFGRESEREEGSDMVGPLSARTSSTDLRSGGGGVGLLREEGSDRGQTLSEAAIREKIGNSLFLSLSLSLSLLLTVIFSNIRLGDSRPASGLAFYFSIHDF